MKLIDMGNEDYAIVTGRSGDLVQLVYSGHFLAYAAKMGDGWSIGLDKDTLALSVEQLAALAGFLSHITEQSVTAEASA